MKNNCDKKKQVVLFISSLSGGGAEGVCVNLANGLAELGLDVTLLVLHLNNADYLDRVNDKVNLVSLDINSARFALFPLFRYIIKNKCKKWIVFNYELTVILVFLRYFLPFRIYIVSRNINTLTKNVQELNSLWGKYIVAPLINIFYGKVDHIVNQCQGMQDDLIKAMPSVKDKVSVINNPVNSHIEEFTAHNDVLSIEKENYILCVGRLEKQKAFHYAIEAFSLIVNEHPLIRLKIVGQGSLLHELKQVSETFGVSDKVDFEGFQTDTIKYYTRARLTLMSSLYEGFPNVLVESITLGTPIVSFDCPSGPKEIIQHGGGRLVEYQNVAELAKAMSLVLLNPPNGIEVIKSSRNYSRYYILQKWVDI